MMRRSTDAQGLRRIIARLFPVFGQARYQGRRIIRFNAATAGRISLRCWGGAGTSFTISTESQVKMSWVTFEVAGGGLIAVQPQHVVAISGGQESAAKLSATASGFHVLNDTTVQRAAMRLTAAVAAGAASAV